MILEIFHPNPLAPFGTPGVSYAVTENIGTFLIKCAYQPVCHWSSCGGFPLRMTVSRSTRYSFAYSKTHALPTLQTSLIFTKGEVIFFSLAPTSLSHPKYS